jgi:catechol 2,3-dioxygenase-like lactoylglutathione lyase family enzyme/nitrite reductase/ring-hydroxylating ferredoxin subunit
MALVSGLNHLLVQVTNLDRSEAFYRDVFGLDVVGRNLVNEEGPNSLLRAAGPHLILLVEVAEVTPFRPHSMSIHHALYLREEQYNRAIERRSAAGFDVGDSRAAFRAKGQLSFDVFDPDGHRYQVQSVGKASSEQLKAGVGDFVCGNIQDFAVGSVTHFENEQFYLVREAAGFLALSHWCPHMNGMVRWRESYWSFYCPFHSATFNRLGECTAHQRYPTMRMHPVSVAKDGQVVVDTDTVIKRPRGHSREDFTPVLAGATVAAGG